MSEIINNREQKQKILKEVIMELHQGKNVEEVQDRFAQLIEGVSPAEISAMEQSLIDEGLPVEEVQRLCDVHAAVFKGSLAEFHRSATPVEVPVGHPIHTFRQENKALEGLIEEKITPFLALAKQQKGEETRAELIQGFEELWEIDKHYSRKENLLFPYLEKHGIVAPPKVMWGVDDEIRDAIKEIRFFPNSKSMEELLPLAEETIHRVKEMIYKEENILFPMALETLTQDEWVNILRESDDIGYCLYQPEEIPEAMAEAAPQQPQGITADQVLFETGTLKADELNAIFNSLPLDITFIDANDRVKYFSQGQERIFHRTKAVIGREVENCHPPGSVHVVEKLVADFKSGVKDTEEFWLPLGDAYVYIRYFAIRDENGNYLGTMETTQNIAPIQRITGEKRLLDD